MLTLASYLEERAAKLKQEALGRCQVAFAGSPPNSLHYIVDEFFGFKDDTASEASGTDPLQSFTRLVTDEQVPAAPKSFMASAEAAVAKLSAEQAAPPQAATALPSHLRPGQKAKAASMIFSGSESEGGASTLVPCLPTRKFSSPDRMRSTGRAPAWPRSTSRNQRRANTTALCVHSMKEDLTLILF